MAGHGLRFLALQLGCWLEVATFLGGLTVGAVAARMARSSKTPVAVIAFAGAVTMIPGLSLYRPLGGALELARQAERTDPGMVAKTLDLLHDSHKGLRPKGLRQIARLQHNPLCHKA